ncbi:MAG: ABC transporter permease [Deltaproteobacteria bacterium]|nr:MAG: ABC transporter permease [Deltaproteobacteria bacterium]
MWKSFKTWWKESRVVKKFSRDRTAMASLVVIGLYALVFLWTMVTNLDVDHVNKLSVEKPNSVGWLQSYNQDTGKIHSGPSGKQILGTDKLGRDIFKRLLVSVNVAFKIGLVTAFIACLLGLLLGGLAGYYGGWVDLVITWIYSVFSSIPYIVLVLLIAAIFKNTQGLTGLYVAFGLSFWIGPARVVRGEIMKIKELEYVQAAQAVGNSSFRILIRHVLPNTMHLIFVYFSLLFIGAIKSEVILTFLDLGVKGMPSWGLMIADASKDILSGFWWQMIGASIALFGLVYAFNIFTDALQDALDPKHHS